MDKNFGTGEIGTVVYCVITSVLTITLDEMLMTVLSLAVAEGM